MGKRASPVSRQRNLLLQCQRAVLDHQPYSAKHLGMYSVRRMRILSIIVQERAHVEQSKASTCISQKVTSRLLFLRQYISVEMY